MDSEKVINWFTAIFRGEWEDVTDQGTVPASVSDDSREWATLLLESRVNPYKNVKELNQRMFLGLGTSPDQLITISEYERTHIQLTINETLQHFVITREKISYPKATVKKLDGALLTIQEDFLPLLSNKAKNVVQETINTSLKKANIEELETNMPVLLSYSSVAVNAITYWFDRVNLIWLENRLYIDFYKTYPGSAVIFRPGLDWYPEALRLKANVKR